MRRLLVLVSLLLVTPYFTGQNAKANDFLERLEQKRNTQAALSRRWSFCIKDGRTRSGKSFKYAYADCLKNVVNQAKQLRINLLELQGQYYVDIRKYTDIVIWERNSSTLRPSTTQILVSCETANFAERYPSWKVPKEGSVEEAVMIAYCSNP